MPKHEWTINALLLCILALLIGFYVTLPTARVQAAGGGWDTNGIVAVTTQKISERLVIIDTSKQNICIYRNQGAGQFRLVGARCYKYDVEIKDSKGTDIEKGNGVTYLQTKEIYEKFTNKP